jgi:opacity protein-like surface antigen
MSGRSSRHLIVVLASALGAAIGVSALPAKTFAADLDSSAFPTAPLGTEPVEFGTGWYIRGDAAFAMDTLPQISPLGFFPDTSGLRNTYSLGGGGGYKFNNWFRTDVTFDWREPLESSDSATSTYAYGTRWDALVNGYVDLGTWSGFTPYLGAGVGVAWGQAKYYTRDPIFACTAGGTVTCFEQNTPMNLAFSLMAGVAFEIFPHAYLDVGYRYLNLGAYSFYDNSVLPNVGAITPPGNAASRASSVQEIRFGIRYLID